VTKGITVGETVVTDGQLRLTPNARVDIKSDSDNAAAAAPSDGAAPSGRQGRGGAGRGGRGRAGGEGQNGGGRGTNPNAQRTS
jgi:hypothetical protein